MKRTTRPKNYNWQALVRSAARKVWLWSPMRRQAIQAARVGKGLVQCVTCGRVMLENPKKERKSYEVDHTIPASEPAAKIKSWDSWLERLFVSASGLRVMCKSCHSTKTEMENGIRRIKKPARRKSIRVSR